MNNNIIKSLRRTLLCTVAAAAVAIGFTACVDDSIVTQNATTAPANGTSYKFSIPANMGGGDSRAIAYNSETDAYDKTFEMSDRIMVYNVNKKAQGYKLNKWDGGEDKETAFLYPDANGKVANLCGEIDGFFTWNEDSLTWDDVTPEEGDTLMLFYNSWEYLNYNRDFSNDYSYNSNSKFADYAIATVAITSVNEGVITTEPSSFWNPQSIYKINFTGIASDVKIKKVTVKSAQNRLVSEYAPLDANNWFNSVSYKFPEEGADHHELLFFLRFAENPYYDQDTESTSGDELSFLAVGSDGHYYKGAKSVTTDLKNGMYYQADVAMADAGLAMTLKNDATGELVDLYEWTYLSTKDAAYTAENTGLETSLNWYGGNQTLTLKNVTVINSNYNAFIDAQSDGSEDSRVHKLILDGVNSLNTGLRINENCSLFISALSGGKLNITDGGVYVGMNATMEIESGEVSIDYISYNSEDYSSVILSKDAKLRIKDDYIYPFVKAAEGYVLTVSLDGEYWAYTAIEDDGSGLAKNIVVTPATATLGYGNNNGQGVNLRAYVFPETTTDKSVTWTTSNPNVVGVDEDGWAYSTGVGTAIVTATTNDGTNLSAQCEITVKPFGGIWYENYEVKVTPESQPFTNPLKQVGHFTSITYTSSDDSVATVDAEGKVTIAAGATVGQTVTITATATAEEDGEYIYPYWMTTSSYTVTLKPATGQGERNDYTPGGSL